MKFPRNSPHAPPHSDLHNPKPKTPSTTRFNRFGAPTRKPTGPGTPLLNWKKQSQVPVSARRLAAGLWRLHMPEMEMDGYRRSEDRLGVQHGIGHVGPQFHGRPNGTPRGSDLKHISQSPPSISGTKSGHFCEPEPPFQFSNTEMEGATKWDPLCFKTSDEAQHIYSHVKLVDQKVHAISTLEAELKQAHAQIQKLETEHHSSKKKLENFLEKVSEERAQWRRREHEKIRAYIDDIKSELNRERKSRKRIEIVNSRLVNELADVKLSAKCYMQNYDKERKARELIEEVCDELAKEIGEDKAEVEALKRESLKFREEVEEERRMLQMAEVWREERVQMKLIDAKVALEEKYSQMNKLVADLETFLNSRGLNPNLKEMREAQSLQQAATAMNIQDIKGFSYEPPNSDDIFSIFEDANFGDPDKRDIKPCVSHSPASHASKIHRVSPEANVVSKDDIQRYSDLFMDDNGDIEGDESGWETVSHTEDQGSSYSPEGSAQSLSKNHRESNVSRRSVLEWEQNAGEETPITETSEVCSIPLPAKQSKKVSSIVRLWRSGLKNGDNYKIIAMEGINERLSNGRFSNVGIMSPDHGSGKGGLSPQDLLYQLSSPESGNPHSQQGMKGCIPRGTQKNSLKSKLFEAKMESQKVQLRHVLKQKY
ncbi:unnamed protein product [Lupinus luteus]|uniref:Uncharacterized protein n=1 Tax=Lupinus luteus TaxID=3873 RepID=A0AAV1X2L0_LUPLU